jgi:hypothetical protein
MTPITGRQPDLMNGPHRACSFVAALWLHKRSEVRSLGGLCILEAHSLSRHTTSPFA